VKVNVYQKLQKLSYRDSPALQLFETSGQAAVATAEDSLKLVLAVVMHAMRQFQALLIAASIENGPGAESLSQSPTFFLSLSSPIPEWGQSLS
jgi:hypothetical protein